MPIIMSPISSISQRWSSNKCVLRVSYVRIVVSKAMFVHYLDQVYCKLKLNKPCFYAIHKYHFKTASTVRIPSSRFLTSSMSRQHNQSSPQNRVNAAIRHFESNFRPRFSCCWVQKSQCLSKEGSSSLHTLRSTKKRHVVLSAYSS